MERMDENFHARARKKNKVPRCAPFGAPGWVASGCFAVAPVKLMHACRVVNAGQIQHGGCSLEFDDGELIVVESISSKLTRLVRL